MPGTPRQTFRISETMWKEFQRICARHGFTASEVLRRFIRAVVLGKISLKELPFLQTLSEDEQKQLDQALLEWLKNRHLQK